MAFRWILIVDRDLETLAALEEAFKDTGFRVTVAEDEHQGFLQARELKPVAIMSDCPFRDNAALDGIPFLLTSKPLDAARVKSRVLELIKQKETPPPAPIEAPAPAEPPAVKAPSRWLLLVGTDPATPAIVEMAILGMGLEVASAGDAAEAFVQARTLKPEMIICDLDLPGFGSGFDQLREFRKNPDMSAIPFIFVSGQDAEKTAVRLAPDDPTVRFTKKPLDLEKLRALVLRQMTGAYEEAAEAEVLPEAAGGKELMRGSALVLDCDPAVRGALDGALADLGFTTTAGEVALALSQAREFKPALIISDLQAAGAVDLLTEMRLDALLLGIPFLFIGDLPVEKAMGMLPWGDATVRFTKKPLDLEKLKALVMEMTDQSSQGGV